MYELVIVWYDGTQNVYRYASEDAAERGEDMMKMANGDQIAWSCVRRCYK